MAFCFITSIIIFLTYVHDLLIYQYTPKLFMHCLPAIICVFICFSVFTFVLLYLVLFCFLIFIDSATKATDAEAAKCRKYNDLINTLASGWF